MTKKTRDIVSDFANNDMPAEVQEQFRCWLDEHAGDGVAEEQLLEEWNSAKLGPVNGAAYEQSFERLMRSMPEVSPVPAPKTAVSRAWPLRGGAWQPSPPSAVRRWDLAHSAQECF